MSFTCAPGSSLIHVPVGWGNNVHVPVHTQAQQPHHLSCCPADTGTALSWSVSGGVVWGGVGWDNNVHVPVHTQAQQTHHLSCCPTDTGTALSWSVRRRHVRRAPAKSQYHITNVTTHPTHTHTHSLPTFTRITENKETAGSARCTFT